MTTRGRDAGFSLVETMVALGVFSLLMASTATVFISSTRQAGSLRDRQQAAALATQVLEVARSVSAKADASGCVPMLQGRTQTAVTTQWSAAPAGVDLTATDAAWTLGTCTGSIVLPLQGLTSSSGAVLDPVVTGGQSFTVTTYIGTCKLATSGGACVKAAVAPAGAVTLYRVVAAVTWPGSGVCGTTCSYSASTLIDPTADPQFDSRQLTVYPPTLVSAVPGDGQVTLTWSVPSTGAAILSYTATATQVGQTTGTTCTVIAPLLTCTITGLTNGYAYNASVKASSGTATSQASNTLQFRPYPASVMSSSALKLWLDGADTTTLFSSSTCTGAPATAAVGCWVDKSTSANNATQSTGSAQGSVASLNSLGAVMFDGSADYYSLNVAKLPTGTTSSTIWTVAVQEDTLPGFSCWRHVIAWGAASTGAARMIHKVCWGTTAYLETYNTYGGMNGTIGWPTGAAAIVDGSVTSTGVTLNVNGAPSYVWSGAANTGTSSGALLGVSPWSSGYWKGRIAEVIVVTGAATAAQNQAVWTYLANKWGVGVVPGTPTGLSVTRPTSSSATVSWTAPSYTGSGPITSYTLSGSGSWALPWSVSKTCSASPCTITGISSLSNYTWTVTANSAAGSSPASATVTG